MLSFKAKVEFKNIQQEVNEQLFKDVSILRKELKEMKMNYEEFKREVLSNILQLNKPNQDLYEQLSVQNNQHTDTIQNLNEQLSKLLSDQNPFIGVLNTLPPNYPLRNVLVNGMLLETSNFLSINPENTLAHFMDENSFKTVDTRKIESISW